MTLSTLQRDYLAEAVTVYEAGIGQAGAYLGARGITPEVAATFRLGFVTSPLPGDDEYVGRLTIPYLAVGDGIHDIRFRAISDGVKPKYLSHHGTKPHLFNVRALEADSDVIVIVEGELDAVVMHGLVGLPCVAVPGAQNWKPLWRLLMEDYRRVVVACDGDDAGKGFGKTVQADIDGAIVVHYPPGMDTNDMYLSEGPDGVRKRIGL